jgi:small nuclear ribonucleoprotein (snRNP)-like protein
MNVVVDEAEEVYTKDSKPRRSIGACRRLHYSCPLTEGPLTGRILLKGDNITLIQPAGAS